jgi:hypothetical protein
MSFFNTGLRLAMAMALAAFAGIPSARSAEQDEEGKEGGMLPVIIGGASVLVGGAYIIDKEGDDGSDGAAETPAPTASTQSKKESSSQGGNDDDDDDEVVSPKAGVIANMWVLCPHESGNPNVFASLGGEPEQTDSQGRSFIEDANARFTIISESIIQIGASGTESGVNWTVVQGSIDDNGCLVLDYNGTRIAAHRSVSPDECTECGAAPPSP